MAGEVSTKHHSATGSALPNFYLLFHATNNLLLFFVSPNVKAKVKQKMKNKINVSAKEWKMGIEHLGNAFMEMHPHAFDDAHGLDDVARVLVEYIIHT